MTILVCKMEAKALIISDRLWGRSCQTFIQEHCANGQDGTPSKCEPNNGPHSGTGF